MKKYALIALGVLSMAVLPACTDVNTHNGASAVRAITVPEVYQSQCTVGEQIVEGKATCHALFNIFTWGVSNYGDYTDLAAAAPSIFDFIPNPSNVAKSGATYNACQAAKCDDLIGARYKVTSKNYFVYKCVKAEVSGYPATIKKLKKVE